MTANTKPGPMMISGPCAPSNFAGATGPSEPSAEYVTPREPGGLSPVEKRRLEEQLARTMGARG